MRHQRRSARLALALALAALTVATAAVVGSAGAELPPVTDAWPLGRVSLTYPASRLVPTGTRAVALTNGATGSTHCPTVSTLEVADLAEPTAPRVVGTYRTTNAEANDVPLQGSYAYRVTGPNLCAQFEGDLQVVDLSDPRAPVLRGRVTAYGWYSAVATSGAYTFAVRNPCLETCPPSPLDVVDVSDPDHPRVATTYTWTDGGPGSDILVGGTVAYVLEFVAGRARRRRLRSAGAQDGGGAGHRPDDLRSRRSRGRRRG
jgi:hypothetical protein